MVKDRITIDMLMRFVTYVDFEEVSDNEFDVKFNFTALDMDDKEIKISFNDGFPIYANEDLETKLRDGLTEIVNNYIADIADCVDFVKG